MMEFVKLNDGEIAHDFSPFFKVYKDGYIERCVPIIKVPPSHELPSSLRSKDVLITTEPPISARIFMPQMAKLNSKLPVLIYIHGGGFALRSPFDPIYQKYVASIATEANVIAVSIEYRLAPEHPIPTGYEDSWTSLQWVASHANGHGAEPWLNIYGDFSRVFLAGDSAGANIAYNLAVRIRSVQPKMRLAGMILMHPFFMGSKLDRMWFYLCPRNGGLKDARFKPASEDMARTGCERVLVFLAGRDKLKDAGRSFYEELNKCGWEGNADMVEHDGVGHVFHLLKPRCEQALDMMKRLVSFINQEPVITSWRSKI
ncbi:hypothetical protein DKX38_006202 [Salix brachista]|uniref:Alpha/beta hydrolase fold-3 domain-containing protein n=1 Tax=Salix brachista TaxID=2182728 RepID=A0A5N5N195_9ROSI|nr:hypothetical protein DKX38_006202 [Salix brachista]